MKRFLFILFLFITMNLAVAAETDTTNIAPDTNIEQTQQENDILDVNNPINYDASPQNIKENNYNPKPAIKEQTEEIIQDVKKEVKEEIKENINKKVDEIKTDNTRHFENENEQTPEEKSVINQYLKDIEEEEKTQNATQPKTYSQDDYEQVYRDLPVPTFTYVHGIDPDQYYEMKDATWSPYPLLRLNAPIYFKSIVVQPGYYLLTPRQYKKDWYILFKQEGVVKYTIPVFAKNFTSESYYRNSLKELDMKKSQRWQIKFLNAWGKYIKRSKRKPAVKTNLELTDLDNNFLLIDLYYGHYKYSTIFKTERF